MVWVWGILTAVALVFEFITAGLQSIWFAAGGFITLLVVLIFPELALIWQFTIFVGSSCVLLLSTRKLVAKFTRTTAKLNTDALVGKQFAIEKQKSENVVYHRIADVEWRVVEENEQPLKEKDNVEIIQIKGNKLIVKKINKKG